MQGDTGQATLHPQVPLTREEMEPLWRWERQVSWLNVASMSGFLLAGLAANRFGDLAWVNRPLLAGAIVLLLASAMLQLRARCPRCGTRLRGKIMRLLSDKCPACGVGFPRPPSASG